MTLQCLAAKFGKTGAKVDLYRHEAESLLW